MLAPRFRAWAAAIAVFAALSSYGIADRPDAYRAPVFNSVVALAPLWVWSVVWAAVAVVALCAAATRSALLWRLSTLAAICAALIWLAGITWAHFVDGERLSLTGWALWLWFAFTNFRAVSTPRQFSDERTPHDPGRIMDH